MEEGAKKYYSDDDEVEPEKDQMKNFIEKMQSLKMEEFESKNVKEFKKC